MFSISVLYCEVHLKYFKYFLVFKKHSTLQITVDFNRFCEMHYHVE